MASAIDSTKIVSTAQQLHGLTKTSCAALGRLLTGASLMGAMLKSDKASLTVKVMGEAPWEILWQFQTLTVMSGVMWTLRKWSCP